GIAVMSTKNPHEIIVARKGSPLIVGLGDDELFIASDASALVGHTNQVVYLSDGEIGVCTKGGIELFDIDANALAPSVEKLELDLQSIQKKGYDHFLLKEIYEQPESLSSTLLGRVSTNPIRAQLGGLNMTDDELRAVEHV